MAVGKGKEDDLDEAYEILGVAEDADDKEIQAAFRKGSLKCHPDRNPDDPNAAEKFDQLSRCKDFLLDPAKRAELDRKRKAKSELLERFAHEDAKRRKLREDLEGREAAHASGKPRRCDEPSREELRKRAAQMDYAARLKAKQAEVAERQNEVVAEVVQTRAAAEEARIRISWRAGSPPCSVEVLRQGLKEFDVTSLEVSEAGGIAQLSSREEALRAILECRARKHQLPFRVALATGKKAEAGETPTAAAQPKRTEQAKDAKPSSGGFDDWEAQMLAGLQGLAKKQQATKA
jgi:curved DNA-binding protein CbpA